MCIRDRLAPLATGEVHRAIGQGEERVIAAEAHVVTGMELGAPLADDDRPGAHRGAAEGFHPQALGVRIASVAGGAATLGLGHSDYSLCSTVPGDSGDTVRLTRAGRSQVRPRPDLWSCQLNRRR